MRCKSSGLNFKPLSLDNGPFNKDTTVFSFWGTILISSSGTSGRIALHGRPSSLFLAGHDAIGGGDVGNFTSLGDSRGVACREGLGGVQGNEGEG